MGGRAMGHKRELYPSKSLSRCLLLRDGGPESVPCEPGPNRRFLMDAFAGAAQQESLEPWQTGVQSGL